MDAASTSWAGNLYRRWLDRQLAAAKLDEAAADRSGYLKFDGYERAIGDAAVR